MIEFLKDLANAHQRKEGWKVGSLTQRLNNPGALRYKPYHVAYGAIMGDLKFAKFPTFESGFQALMDDLRTKIMGHSSSEKLHYENNPSFFTYVSVYAPSEDYNDPLQYAKDLIAFLPQYDLSLDMPLAEIAEKYISAPFVPKKLVLSEEAELKRLKNTRRRALLRFSPPFLTRLLARIDKRLSGQP